MSPSHPGPILQVPNIETPQPSTKVDSTASAAGARKPYDEGGHSLSKIQSITRRSGDSVGVWFGGLFSVVIGLTSLGSSVTFSYVINNSQPQIKPHTFSVESIQLFISISWLLFLLALASASLGSTVLTFFRDHWIEDWDGNCGLESQKSVQTYAVLAIFWLTGLVIAAFVFLCLVVIAYSPYVGWTALGCTIAFALLVFTVVLFQVPWSWRDNTPATLRQKRAIN